MNHVFRSFGLIILFVLQVSVAAAQPIHAPGWDAARDHFSYAGFRLQDAVTSWEEWKRKTEGKAHPGRRDSLRNTRKSALLQWTGSAEPMVGFMVGCSRRLDAGLSMDRRRISARLEFDFGKASLLMGLTLDHAQAFQGGERLFWSTGVLRRRNCYGPLWVFTTGRLDWAAVGWSDLKPAHGSVTWSAGLEWRAKSVHQGLKNTRFRLFRTRIPSVHMRLPLSD